MGIRAWGVESPKHKFKEKNTCSVVPQGGARHEAHSLSTAQEQACRKHRELEALWVEAFNLALVSKE